MTDIPDMSSEPVPKEIVSAPGRSPAATARDPDLLIRKYQNQLVPLEVDGFDEQGRRVVSYMPPPRIDGRARLIPLADCKIIEAAIEHNLQCATYEEARELAQTIMRRYARRDLYDPTGYMFELTRVFGEHPRDLGQRAADALRASHFLPNVGDVLAVLAPLTEARRRELAQAQAHIAEHRRRDQASKPSENQGDTIRAFKSYAGSLRDALGERVFNAIWGDLHVDTIEPHRIDLSQPTPLLRTITLEHVATLESVFGRRVEIRVRAASERRHGGFRSMGEITAGGSRQ